MKSQAVKAVLLATVATFAVSALAQVAVKPRVEVKPGAPVEVKPTGRTMGVDTVIRQQSTDLGAFKKTQSGVPAVALPTQTTVRAESCSREEIMDKLDDGNDLSAAEIDAALKAGLKVQGCKAGDRGVANMSGLAKAIAVRSTNIWASLKKMGNQALADAKNAAGIRTTAEQETPNVLQLTDSSPNGCNILPAGMAAGLR